jgi:6-pyruvoyltetrahydropterin/6-carboxytetrahydropterin synthase
MKGQIEGTRIRVTKTFHFEMAHALYGYDGPCKNIHGHSYSLSVTMIGKTITENGNSKLGMVVDFSDLKKIIETSVISKFDHTLILNEKSPHKKLIESNLLLGKVTMVNYQPTCENLLIDFAKLIQNNIPATIKLHHLKLRETSTSFAEWYAEDNK